MIVSCYVISVIYRTLEKPLESVYDAASLGISILHRRISQHLFKKYYWLNLEILSNKSSLILYRRIWNCSNFNNVHQCISNCQVLKKKKKDMLGFVLENSMSVKSLAIPKAFLMSNNNVLLKSVRHPNSTLDINKRDT